jgi:adenosylcobinamide amidohydrolase
LEKGYIVAKDRSGKVTASPIMTISIGVATNRFLPFSHVGEIIQTATELKNYAKTFSKSTHIIDRRKK